MAGPPTRDPSEMPRKEHCCSRQEQWRGEPGSRLQGRLAEREEQLGRRGGRCKGEIDEHFEIGGRFETRLLSRREFESIFLQR